MLTLSWNIIMVLIAYTITSTCKQYINLLKPTGYVMHQQFNIPTTVRSAHTVFICFVFTWEQTATCAT